MIMNRMNVTALLALSLLVSSGHTSAAQDGDTPSSRYMGGPAELVTAPNGAIVNAEMLEATPKVMYLEPITEKVADGVWCIGGYSLANTTVIEAEDGLIVYDTGDNNEEAEHRNIKIPSPDDLSHR